MLLHRLRSWPNNKPTVVQRLVFAGIHTGISMMVSWTARPLCRAKSKGGNCLQSKQADTAFCFAKQKAVSAHLKSKQLLHFGFRPVLPPASSQSPGW